MNNGQINVASTPIVTPLVTPDQTIQVTTAVEGLPQNVGGFADLLSGIQQSAKGNGPGEPGQTEALPLDIGTENPAVDHLALLNVSPQFMTVAGPAVPKSDEEPQKTVVFAEAEHVGNTDSDMALQMAMAAYVMSGRTPDVGIPAPLSVDKLQNVAIETVQSAAITASTAISVELQSVPVIVQAAPTAVTPDAPARAGEANKPVPLFVDPLQNAPGATEQAAVITASAAPSVAPVVVQTTPAAVEPETSARTGTVSKAAPLSVDTLQNVAGATEQAAVITASVAQMSEPVEVQTSQAVVRPEVPLITGEVNKTAQLSGDRLQNVAEATDQPEQNATEPLQNAAQRPAIPVVERLDKSESANKAAPSMASSPDQPSDLELEIQLSQPRPITARDASVSVSAAAAAAVNDSHNIRLRLSSDLQIEKVKPGDESLKEAASTLPMEASESTSTSDPETSNSSGNNQGEPESASDNQSLTQQMRGQLSTEHHKISAATKQVIAEPVRQEFQEQVVQQVKDRLLPHDVKPGNQQITLTLSPENLGELKMNLNLQGQKLSVEIVTENRTVRDIIVQHTEALKESLARQNITMESFDVTTGGKGSGNQGQNQNAWRELAKQQQQQQIWMPPRGYTAAQADLPSELAMSQRRQGQSMLDIHY